MSSLRAFKDLSTVNCGEGFFCVHDFPQTAFHFISIILCNSVLPELAKLAR